MKFTKTISIRFGQADPAQIMYFANILDICHGVFEDFIQEAGITWDEWFKPSQWACPIRHTETNFLAPLLPGKTYLVEVSLSKMGDSSFQMHYIIGTQGSPHADVKIVHTFVEQKSFKKTSVPPQVIKALKPYLEGTQDA